MFGTFSGFGRGETRDILALLKAFALAESPWPVVRPEILPKVRQQAPDQGSDVVQPQAEGKQIVSMFLSFIELHNLSNVCLSVCLFPYPSRVLRPISTQGEIQPNAINKPISSAGLTAEYGFIAVSRGCVCECDVLKIIVLSFDVFYILLLLHVKLIQNVVCFSMNWHSSTLTSALKIQSGTPT
jgi:hypothetical protein